MSQYIAHDVERRQPRLHARWRSPSRSNSSTAAHIGSVPLYFAWLRSAKSTHDSGIAFSYCESKRQDSVPPARALSSCAINCAHSMTSPKARPIGSRTVSSTASSAAKTTARGLPSAVCRLQAGVCGLSADDNPHETRAAIAVVDVGVLLRRPEGEVFARNQ